MRANTEATLPDHTMGRPVASSQSGWLGEHYMLILIHSVIWCCVRGLLGRCQERIPRICLYYLVNCLL